MPEITAKLVNELRALTGQGMMECKKMLATVEGDIQKAIDGFRKKGVKTSITERTTSEGRIIGSRSDDGRAAALVEVNCNTDFTAKSEPVQQLGMAAAKILLANPSANVAADPAIAAKVTEVAQQTGENVHIGRTAIQRIDGGKVGLYIYTVTGKIGVLVSVAGDPSDELLRDLGLHITGRQPRALALSREQLPADIVAREKEIAVAQAIESGKPKPIAEKIAEGKMRLFYEDRVLLDQPFVNPDKFKGSIGDMLKAAGATIKEYMRMEVGQAS
jgi:elongation factor Ts